MVKSADTITALLVLGQNEGNVTVEHYTKFTVC